MAANKHLELAWQAERAGRPRLSDVMLTLAIADSGPADHWTERARKRLIQRRPDHFFARFDSLATALSDPSVHQAVERLRAKYPPPRVDWLLLAGNASRGLFTGVEPGKSIILNDLFGAPAEADVRRDSAEPIRGPVAKTRVAAASRVGIFPAGHSVVDVSPLGVGLDLPPSDDEIQIRPAGLKAADESLSNFYLSVLFSMALLLALTNGRPQGASAAN
jgi:hypothetical protein